MNSLSFQKNIFFKALNLKSIKQILLVTTCLICSSFIQAQGDYNDDDTNDSQELAHINPLNDKNLIGQTNFVKELLTLSGYIIKKIEVYQTLPNHAKVFQVKLEPNIGAFIFVRWSKEKKENFIANKLIDSEIYYNLNASKEIMRKQTEQDSFGVEDIALQAPDQEELSVEEVEKFRQEFQLQEKEKELQKIKEENRVAKKKNKKRKN